MATMQKASIALVFTVVTIQATEARDLPLRSIVHGQRLQPSNKELKALNYSDMDSKQAAEIDETYRRLMDMHSSQRTRPTTGQHR